MLSDFSQVAVIVQLDNAIQQGYLKFMALPYTSYLSLFPWPLQDTDSSDLCVTAPSIAEAQRLGTAPCSNAHLISQGTEHKPISDRLNANCCLGGEEKPCRREIQVQFPCTISNRARSSSLNAFLISRWNLRINK